MPTRVKICGVTRRDDAELAVELGASALGFNFYPPSPRYIAPAAAREIIQKLPPFITAVGVFADETDASHVTAVADEAGVSVVQLHGPNFPADNGVGHYPMIRAISMGLELDQHLAEKAQKDLEFLVEQAVTLHSGTRFPGADSLLLDTADPLLRGGTGRTFDWKMARQIALRRRVILAGGLTPENVGDAIRQVHPYAVDVASGVECAPGVKDPTKLRAFFAAVVKVDRES